jgi:hypothetical protein
MDNIPSLLELNLFKLFILAGLRPLEAAGIRSSAFRPGAGLHFEEGDGIPRGDITGIHMLAGFVIGEI